MNLQLKNKTALITGSTAGIGFATAKQLAAEGVIVYVNGRTQQRIDEAIELIKKEVPEAVVKGVAADFLNVSEVNELIKQIPEVDILINNVAIFEPRPFAEIPDEDWMKFYEVNVLSGIRLSRHYFPKMMEKNWGRIIFISSESALNIPEEMIHYGMTKTAQLAISRGLAQLTKGTNVTVNSVLPGPTKSEGVSGFIEQMSKQENKSKEVTEKEFFQLARPTSILQRFTSTDEIAHLIVYIASPLSSATNGAALKADGGVSRFII
jgi:NAD(P)-dependent dehydrogenase (short-subunit alcohol dehydrogenase family)